MKPQQLLLTEQISTAEITVIKGIKVEQARKFAALGIHTVADLILTYPRFYLDYSQIVPLSGLDYNTPKTAIVRVTKFNNYYLRGKLSLQRAYLQDEEGQEINAVWFNMPFLEKQLPPGQQIAITAKLSLNKRNGKLQLNAPNFEKYTPGKELINTGRIVPVYKLSAGISPKNYRKYIRKVLDNINNYLSREALANNQQDYPKNAIETMLAEQIGRSSKDGEAQTGLYYLDPLSALKQIHFPQSQELLDSAKYRLGIEELVPLQLKMMSTAEYRAKSQSLTSLSRKNESRKEPTDVITTYWQNYNFTPTHDQLLACKEIVEEFRSKKPIHRLIQGDVGSGKTAVAAFAAQLVLNSGLDVVFMVPTTILAKQHSETLQRLFPEQVEIVISGSDLGSIIAKRRENPEKARIFLGTQALLHQYQKLPIRIGMLIIDEEHRFGVRQRQEIAELGQPKDYLAPHYLSLTATPIPRTLAHAIFGGINISIIATKPQNRLEKITYIVPSEKRSDSYNWIENLVLNQNYQAFWVCPLIETTKQIEDTTVVISRDEKASISKTYAALTERFPSLNIAALHGKMKQAEKEQILTDFRTNKTHILVSTSVIEVGIDIPNANIIAIENPERFGLAQLHQLRGRVGRSKTQGYCLLFPGKNYTESDRLKYFAHENDGLKLAEYDLQSRGPGEVYGRLQSGIPEFKLANIFDTNQMRIAKMMASLYKESVKNNF